MSQRTPQQTLDNLVDHLVSQQGITEQQARCQVLRDCPDLRQRLVDEANAGQPPRGIRPRPDLADRAAAYDGIPRSGRPVA